MRSTNRGPGSANQHFGTDSPVGTTPGPWNVRLGVIERGKNGIIIERGRIGNNDHQPVAILATRNPNKKNDAPLIAAAPDLLDAAKAVLSTLEDWIASGSDSVATVTSRDILRAAIAKAEGNE